MKSEIRKLSSTILSREVGEEEKISAITQFIKINDVEISLINSISTFKNLSLLIRNIFELVYSLNYDESLNCSKQDFSQTLFSFIYRLLTKNQLLRDSFAFNVDFDKLVQTIFAACTKDGINFVDVQLIINPLKVIVALSSSPSLSLKGTKTMEILVKIIMQLIDNAQLSSWCCALIAFLVTHQLQFDTFIKSNENILLIQKKLESLLSSKDVYLSCSALAAQTALFDTTANEAAINLRCAISFVTQSTPYLIMSQLASLTILKLAKKTMISQVEIKMLVHGLFETQEFDTNILIMTIEALSEYHQSFIDELKEDSLIQQFVLLLMMNEDPSCAVVGCHLLRILSELDDSLLKTNEDDDTLLKALTLFKQFDRKTLTEKYESSLIILKMMMHERNLNSEELLLIHDIESVVFNGMVRNIEQSNAYCSVCYFNFIMGCTKDFPKWKAKLNKVVIGTPFIPLVISVMNSTMNLFAARDGMDVFRELCCLSGDVLELCVQSQVELNRMKKDNEKNEKLRNKAIIEDLQKEINIKERVIEELNISNEQNFTLSQSNEQQLKMLESEFYKLKDMNEGIEKENEELKNIIAKLKHDLDETTKEKEGLKQRIGGAEVKIKIISDKNADLEKELDVEKQANERLKSEIEEVRIKIRSLKIEDAYIKKQLSIVREDNDSSTKGCTESMDKLSEAKLTIAKQRRDNKKLLIVIEKLKNGLVEIQEENKSISNENEALNAKLKIVEESKERFRIDFLKMKNANRKLIESISQIENDKNKWEVIAKVSHNIKEKARETLNETYNPLF